MARGFQSSRKTRNWDWLVQFPCISCWQLILFSKKTEELNNTWLVVTSYHLRMLSIELALKPQCPHFRGREPVLGPGRSLLSLLLRRLLSLEAGLAHLQALAATTPPPCSLPFWPIEGRWLCCLLRDPRHWSLLSNLAPCLYCDEWGWADDKQRSLGRRSNAPPSCPEHIYDFAVLGSSSHDDMVPAESELLPPGYHSPNTVPAGKQVICTGATKGWLLKTESVTNWNFLWLEQFTETGSKLSDLWSPFSSTTK